MPPHQVLIVDDDEIVRTVLDEVLTAAGFSVTAACCHQEAMALLPWGHRFAAVVTDLVMPERSGIDLLREIRAAGHRNLPVVILTGSPSLETAMAAVGDSRVRYLTKTDIQGPLVQALRQLIDRRPSQGPVSLRPRPDGTYAEQASPAQFEEALEKLWMAFQPIVSWKERNVFGYEALVRSNHDRLSNPGRLFEAAEQLDRLPDLGRRIREIVARNIAEAPPEAKIFINLHSSDLNDEDLYARESKLMPYAHRVVFEVTERASLECVRNLKERLLELRETGFSIAVDDLGAGYAGLASLSRLEPEVVKLDMSLVRNIDRLPKMQSVIQSVLTACSEDIGVLVVCEGVETHAERDTLLRLGADLLQGYLFGRPSAGFITPTF